MDQFHPFSKLPQAIRLEIWTRVANFPRVVGTRETHDYTIEFTATNLEKPFLLLPTTHAISTTRPPAILGVCREARSLALTTIYKIVAEDIRTKDSPLDRPIYVNPNVDIIYKGKVWCRNGDAFRIRCRDWEEESEPLNQPSLMPAMSDTIFKGKSKA
jgi:2EXR family